MRLAIIIGCFIISAAINPNIFTMKIPSGIGIISGLGIWIAMITDILDLIKLFGD